MEGCAVNVVRDLIFGIESERGGAERRVGDSPRGRAGRGEIYVASNVI